MASKYIGDLCFSTGEYEVQGETKKRWTKAAAAFKDEETGRVSFKFEAMPQGVEWSGWMNLFLDKKDKGPSSNQSGYEKAKEARQKLNDPAPEPSSEPIDMSDIPF